MHSATPSPHQPLARAHDFLRRRFGWASCAAYAAAAVLPAPGMWLRHDHSVSMGGPLPVGVSASQVLLATVLFMAGLRVRPRALAGLLRRPRVLVAGLALHLTAPLLILPLVAVALRCCPDSDGGSGMIAAMILTVAMPVAAGATVWTGQGRGDEPAILGLVLASTFLSPLTLPATAGILSRLLSTDYAGAVATAAHAASGGFALTGVLLPCAAGIGCRLLLSDRARRGVLPVAAPAATLAALLLTYVNASGAIGQFLTHPRPLLLLASTATAATVCVLSFGWGRCCSRVLRMSGPAGTSVTLACGMSNSSAGAVLITTAMPDRPQILLPVLAFSLLQKLAASRATRWRPVPAAG
ncbi:sodium-dependent transporter [Streptomyces sp. NPDC048491]|uniref:bile acid:sodium symporter family protein n=1 Tax=Streptomyces sp. NPDC048491 TaxID=3157207 RepID=UPI00342F95FD